VSLSQAVVVVTGAAGGIGRAIALPFAREGADLTFSCREVDHAGPGPGIADRMRRI
jgi:NAD(P)-dependent dehydrogenase (short-subunit alcohol dehydrogenase family)